MFARLAPLETICLQCQIRLSRRALPSHGRRPFQTTALALRNTGREWWHQKELRHRSRDERVKDSAKLTIDSLGEPSEVIVLPDEDGRDGHQKPAWRSIMLQDGPHEKSLSQEKILEMVESERQTLDQHQISANIESIRERMGGNRSAPIFVPRSEYYDVYDILYKGYTVEQLTAYLQRSHKAPKAVSKKKAMHSVFVDKSIWKPKGSPASGELSDQEIQPLELLDEKSSKGGLVKKLLRDHWRVQVQDAKDVVGELKLRVRPWQLSLLSLGHPSHLEEIGDKRKAKVEGITKEDSSTIRITTDLRTARNAERDFAEILSNIHSKKINLRQWKPGHLQTSPSHAESSFSDWRSLKEIERYTRTNINVAGQDTILLNSTSKTGIEDAQRMLLSMLRLPRNLSSTTVVHGQQRNLIRTLVPYSGRPFSRESKLFSRWVRPSERVVAGKEAATKEVDRLPRSNLASSKQLVSNLTGILSQQTPKELAHLTRYWNRVSTTQVSATLGHALCSHGQSSVNFLRDFAHSQARKDNLDFSRGLIFAPDPCGSVPFLRHLEPSSQGWHTSLKIVLKPSPFTTDGPSVLLKLPEISLHFDVHPASLKLIGIFATVEQFDINVLLPSEKADLRIEARSIIEGSIELQTHKNIQEFCSELQRSYNEADSKLHAPLFVKLPISMSIACPAKLRSLEKAWTEAPDEYSPAFDPTPVTIEYIFATLEQYQTLAFDFNGHQLERSGTEGGRISGSYNEVKLTLRQPSPSSEPPASKDPKSSEFSFERSFIKSALQLVELASNPQPLVHTQSMGWFPGGTDYFKRIQKYDPESDRNEYDQEADPDISLAQKTVADVTNERVNEWLEIQDRERRRQNHELTVQDLLEEAKAEGASLKAIGAGEKVPLDDGTGAENTDKVDTQVMGRSGNAGGG